VPGSCSKLRRRQASGKSRADWLLAKPWPSQNTYEVAFLEANLGFRNTRAGAPFVFSLIRCRSWRGAALQGRDNDPVRAFSVFLSRRRNSRSIRSGRDDNYLTIKSLFTSAFWGPERLGEVTPSREIARTARTRRPGLRELGVGGLPPSRTERGESGAPPFICDLTLRFGMGWPPPSVYCTAMLCGSDGMPFATTYNLLGPSSMPAGTSNFVDMVAPPVATPMLLWLWVLQ
jgi:hypothetical protein